MNNNPRNLFTCIENPIVPTQNLMRVEHPKAPPPLELVLWRMDAESAKRHEACSRSVMAADLLGRRGKRTVGKWTTMPFVLLKCQRCKFHMDLACTFSGRAAGIVDDARTSSVIS